MEPGTEKRLHKYELWGTWVVQSVKRPTSAQVKISQFVSLSPALGSVLTAQSLEPASESVSPSVSALPNINGQCGHNKTMI